MFTRTRHSVKFYDTASLENVQCDAVTSSFVYKVSDIGSSFNEYWKHDTMDRFCILPNHLFGGTYVYGENLTHPSILVAEI
jgi:hypothetical protein